MVLFPLSFACYKRTWAVEHICPKPFSALPHDDAIEQLVCSCVFQLFPSFVDGSRYGKFPYSKEQTNCCEELAHKLWCIDGRYVCVHAVLIYPVVKKDCRHILYYSFTRENPTSELRVSYGYDHDMLVAIGHAG